MYFRNQVREDIRAPMEDSWPIAAALERYQQSRIQTMLLRDERRSGGFSVGFVVARCREDLQWIDEFAASLRKLRNATLFLFEKSPQELFHDTSSFDNIFANVQVTILDD